MQQLLASLVIGMSVKDEAFKAGMASARQEANRTGQDFEKSADTMGGAMQRAAVQVNNAAHRIMEAVSEAGAKVRNAGLAMTAGLTLGLAGMAIASKNSASDFQTAMNSVHSALVTASPEQLNKLRDAALTMGPAVGRSAVEAANAIESLAKNGMSATQILAGGLKSALTLAVVGQSDLGGAADLTTDILAQFSMTASDLPIIVDKVSGALDASKMGFDDYRLAIGQLGGVAGGLGYSFDDMNTALAASASYFQSGSDAGTSFKTFLTMLIPGSKDSERVMTKLGLSFFDASGKAKSLADIAEMLHQKFGKLNDRSLQDGMTKVFGADAMRTAIALTRLGAKGVEDYGAAIDKVSASQKMEILLDGEAAAAQRLSSAWTGLKIQLGNAGIIQAITAIKEAVASMISTIAASPPWFFKVVVAMGAMVAAIGPLVLALGVVAKFGLPLLLARLSPIGAVIGFIIAPMRTLIMLLGSLALQAGAATMIGRMGAAMIGFAGPIGLAIAALTIIIPMMMRTATVSASVAKATDAARAANDLATDSTNKLTTATGKLRVELLRKAVADRQAAVAAMKKAQADLQAAKAAYVRSKASLPSINAVSMGSGSYSGGGGAGQAANASARFAGQQNVDQTRVDLQASIDNVGTMIDTVNKFTTAIHTPDPASAKIDMNFDDPTKKKTKKGRDTSADDEDYAAKLAEVRNAQLQANADLTESYQARYLADMDSIKADRAGYAKQLATDEKLTDAKRNTLMAEKDSELEIRRAVVERARHTAIEQIGYDLAKAQNDAAQEVVQAQSAMADSVAGRRDAELRLLDLQRQQEEADLELILATKATASAEWANADKRKAALAGIYEMRADAVKRNNEGPADSYMRSLNVSASAIKEQVQDIGVSALKDLNAGLSDAIVGTKSLASAFAEMGKRIIASLLDIAIQQAVIKPLANSLFGAADSSGTRSGGLVGSLGSLIASTFRGGKAKGGAVDPSSWYVVGEKGPEIFAPGTSGTVIPNSGRGSSTRGASVTQHITIPGGVDLMTRSEGYRVAGAVKDATMAAIRDADRRRG